MPRPPKHRRVAHIPEVTYFKPAGIPMRQLSEVVLGIDELEALRLKDLAGLEQGQCAEVMGVSQSTLQRTLATARQKVAEALVLGKAIRITGGPVVEHPPRPCDLALPGRHRRRGMGGPPWLQQPRQGGPDEQTDRDLGEGKREPE